MNKDQATLYLIRGVVAGMDDELRVKIEALAAQLREMMAENKDGTASMAIALVGAEMAASE